ncbi:MAG: putative sarcosine dehydrogenase [Ilumatobacteraceae bacterium]|nr:putative sarcosine dehydrogenase [Ilumatobacteraceae bacterium]
MPDTSTSNPRPLPTRAKIVIIGGGILGCSIAYHLTKMGETDVVLLEQHQLTDGATWHAAGLVGQLRSSRNTTRMLEHSVEMYGGLEAETGQAVDWHQVGSLRLACSPDRVLELRRLATMAKSFGLPMEIISPDAAQALFPLMSTEDVLAAAFLPTDGYIDPASVTQAIAKGARNRGAQIHENTRVETITVDGRRITTVTVVQADGNRADIECEIVVNAAGMWGLEVGRMAGARIPAFAVEHQYILTGPITEMAASEIRAMPTLRDPDHLVYYKPDGQGLLVGGYEPNTLAFGETGIPVPFQRQLIDPNMERFEQLAVLAAKRTPVIEHAGIRTVINGPIPYSADADFVMGRTPEIDNFFVATGFLYGIAAGGGAGKMMAEWILEGRPSLDLWPLDVRRFAFHHTTRQFMYPRAVELYGHHYKLSAPGSEHESARGIRRSPLHETLKARRAVFGSRGGWERPNWFAPEGVEAVDRPSFGKPNWFDHVGDECHAVRNGVALVDQTSFAKFEITGPGALAAVQRLSVANMDKSVGTVTYTQLCNERGGIECDLTMSRTAPDSWYVVTGAAFGAHDMGWIRSNSPTDGSVIVRDLTSARAVINICGPLSREVLQSVCEDDVSNSAFRYGRAREITIGSAPVWAMRIGYTGELGWELHIPTEYTAHVYERLRSAGEAHGIIDVGYRAIDRLRLEKGYVYWSTDVTPDTTPWEAGLAWRVDLDKGDFIGCDALVEQRAVGVERSLCTFTLEEMAYPVSGEAIIADGDVVGFTTSANFGHTVGKPVAYGYLPAALAERTDFVIEVYGEPIPATRHDGPLYDPTNARLRS